MSVETLTTTSASKTGLNDDNVIFPGGDGEMERLDLQHQVIYDGTPQLVFAPIDLSKGGCKILDQATGSGIWLRDAREAAKAEKDNTWIGTDIEDAYFPKDPPSDMSYYRQSMTEDWPKDWEGTFDLVHTRLAIPNVGTTSLPEAVRRLIGLVKPGGWIQLVEMEWDGWGLGPEGAVFYTAVRDLISMASNGQGLDLREIFITLYKEAGLENIGVSFFSTPFCARASDKIRSTSEAALFATVTGVSESTKMMPPISVSREKLDAMPKRVLEEAKKDGFEYRFFVVWAQKPASS